MAEPSRTTDPLIGRTINDRFEIIGLIARGGMGKVYRAQQKPLGREVALKVLDPRHSGEEDPDFQARFFLEASTAAKLTHPNTVTVFDYGKTAEDVYFIVMEMVEGRTLSSIVKHGGAVSPQSAIHIAVQIARSLREAHSIGVIHRDLKPANVLITQHADEESFVKVLDFGLVKDLSEDQDLTQQGMFMGSPKYMSPEQIQGAPIDSRTDVYSLGVLLYYMLTARVPFEGSTQVQTLMAHIKNDAPPMTRQDGATVPEELQAIVFRCLRKDPDGRFSSMNDLIGALKAAASMLGTPMLVSAELTGEFDASGIHAAAGVTPSFGVQPQPPVSSHPPSTPPPSGLKRAAPWIGLGVIALALVGSLVVLSSEEPELPATGAAPPAEPAETPQAPQAPPQTPPAEQARCEVTIESEPPGAEVFVGERTYGRTPASVIWVGDNASPGREVTFRFELEGHRSLSVTRTVLEDTLQVRAELTPAPTQRIRTGMRTGMRGMRTTPMNTQLDVRDPDYRDNPY